MTTPIAIPNTRYVDKHTCNQDPQRQVLQTSLTLRMQASERIIIRARISASRYIWGVEAAFWCRGATSGEIPEDSEPEHCKPNEDGQWGQLSLGDR